MMLMVLIMVALILVGVVMVLISPPSKDSELGPRVNVRQLVELGAAAIHSWWGELRVLVVQTLAVALCHSSTAGGGTNALQ